MSGDTSEEVADLDRRNFLKAVGAGVSLSTINLLSEDEAQIGDITYNPEEEVPYVAGWKNHFDEDWNVTKEPVYNTMPVEKWNNIQATEAASQELNSVLESSDLKDGYLGIIETSDEESSTGRRLEVAVSTEAPHTKKEIRNNIPATITGESALSEEEVDIPINIREMKIENHSHECYSQPYKRFDDVPGAAPIYTTDPGGPGCTAGPYVHDEYGLGWITAKHVVEEEGKIVELAEDAHFGTGRNIGEVRDMHFDGFDISAPNDDSAIDVAYIQRTVADKEPYEWIAAEDYLDNADLPITTVLSDQELKARIGDTDWNLKRQGQSTCRTTSYVEDVYKDDGDNIVGVLLNKGNSEGGDSGGPYFHEINGEAYIAGVHKGSHPDNGKAYATTAETTENVLDGNWLTQ